MCLLFNQFFYEQMVGIYYPPRYAFPSVYINANETAIQKKSEAGVHFVDAWELFSNPYEN